MQLTTQETTTPDRQAPRRLALWLRGPICVLSLGLLFLLSCQRVPTDQLQFRPGNCEIKDLLIDNAAYIPHTVKDPPGPNTYQSLFRNGFVHACLVSLWEDVDPGKRNTIRNGDVFYSKVKLLSDGSIEAIEPIEGTTSPIVRFPSYPIREARLHLYVVSEAVGQSSDFDNLCQEMLQPTFRCFSPDNRDKCLFYFRLFPQATPSKPNLKLRESDTGCSLCSPEICDGKDNDCDGAVDNVFGSSTSLTRPCFTGDKRHLLDETKGIGICRIGTQTCKGGWGTCENQQLPLDKELCNNKDDTCDGKIDEGDQICPQGFVCNVGKCEVSPCRANQTPCGDICVVLTTDPANCGACGNKCASGQLCAAGQCVASCPSATPTACGRSCIDTTINRSHCGACGNACEAGSICFQGKCALSCPTSAPACGPEGAKSCCSLSCCDDTCRDTQSDPQHCGSCGNKCPSGSLCFQGTCRVECPTYAPKCGAPGREFCCDKDCCNNSCVDRQTDTFNCGQCGVRCKEGEKCFNGICVLSCPTSAPQCGPPEKETCCSLDCCGISCVDTQNDKNNCGVCGKICEPGYSCVQGTCLLDCPTNAPKCGPPSAQTCCALACCNDSCVDNQNDPRHCGQCGTQCPSGQVCVQGTCTYVCPTAQKLCGNFCIDLSVNPNHCGGCNNKCGPGERCEAQQCLLCPSSAPTCGTGAQRTCCSLDCCNNQCVDTKNNPNHCGACGKQCAQDERCVNGSCQLCPSSAPKCGASSCCSNSCCSGACVDTSYHPLHCGSCNNVCQDGRTCCNGKCINLIADDDNCGRCGRKCPGTQQCKQGVCCARNQQACGGACVDLNSSQQHCGACGNVCPPGQTCNNGQCVCPGTATKCGSVCVDIQNDTTHCGACGNVCATGQTCNNGRCVCPAGQSDCNGRCVNTQTDPNHCGSCGVLCSSPRVCQSGQCLCPTGQTQCGASCVDLTSSDANCGGCGNQCASGTTCCSSSCANTQTDNANCGGCNKPCATGKTCNAGTCVCPSGQTDCNGACVDTQTSNDHCATCNNKCPAGQTCQAGVCQ